MHFSSDNNEELVSGSYVWLDGESYYCIANSQHMPDFFMSLVGASDHWLFISSNGALTAGRRNPDLALFPYYADDQLSVTRESAGSKTLIRVDNANQPQLWEPFSSRMNAELEIHRNLYKNPQGNKLVFEECNDTLQLTFRYRWTFSHRFGFVRSCRLENVSDTFCNLDLLDGLHGLVPYGIGSDFQLRFSNLGNAYKKSELIEHSNHSQIGLFYLSSIPTDKAEPSEGLKATVVWQTGLHPTASLLCTDQIDNFRQGGELQHESEKRGTAGAYLVRQSVNLAAKSHLEWHVVADVGQDHAGIIALDDWLQHTPQPALELDADIQASQQELARIVSSADGIQQSQNKLRCNRHFSNTVFNVMRGGVPVSNYEFQAADFRRHVATFNRSVFEKHQSFLAGLPEVIHIEQLRSQTDELQDPDLTRLTIEYLPLAFSRRHGDPTRPWNGFSIELRGESGETNVNYQGNWRDIFQNWEALLVSFPRFTTAMICRFLNASTADGYNPYRITKNGFEWEEPEPDNPWANIGYWGDHQIIYLLKLLEWSRAFSPEELDRLLNKSQFTYANVPYRIKPYDQITQHPGDTIVFDQALSAALRDRVKDLGTDGKLLRNCQDRIHRATLVEKLLVPALTKISNFVPDGGIWLNTQRPEWNDANNALVGGGLSVVTACYLYRWFRFLHEWFADVDQDTFDVSREVAQLLERVDKILGSRLGLLDGPLSSTTRQQVVDALSQAGSEYREQLYQRGLSGEIVSVTRQECLRHFATCQRFLAVTIGNNRRPDGLYHAYNLLDWQYGGVAIEHLYEMLEGQVAVLSSGLLTPAEAVSVLDALRQSRLYREDQQSYLLYPDRRLARFLEKNNLDTEFVADCQLVQKLLAGRDESIVKRDIKGTVHFNGSFRNAADLHAALQSLPEEYADFVHKDGATLCQEFEELFAHRQFTGRSGTFFAYEGLGSIYWHMVSKLALAVQENLYWAVGQGAAAKEIQSLRNHFREIRQGLGAEKHPRDYGAFPTDPYSHTPEQSGAKQPGMTGQVKEDILSRLAEIGLHISDGCLGFRLDLFDRRELLANSGELVYYDLGGEQSRVKIPQQGFGFTFCQVPVIYQPGPDDEVQVHRASGEIVSFDGRRLDRDVSQLIFSRTGDIKKIECYFKALLN